MIDLKSIYMVMFKFLYYVYIGVKDQSNYQIAGSYRSYSKVIEFYLVVVWIKQIW